MAVKAISTTLNQRLRDTEEHEQRQALRALLSTPMLFSSGPDAGRFAMVRRHAVWLREWLNHNTGWRLQLDSELARLHKSAGDSSDATRGARDSHSDAPLDRRCYLQICLCLVALHEGERQTVLRKLAERVAELSAEDPLLAAAGMTLNLVEREHRRGFIQAVRYLIDAGVLIRVDGDEEQFVKDSGDVLYNVRRSVLTAFLSARRGPSTITEENFEDRLSQLLAETDPETDEGRARRLRWAITRKLLDDPVLYFDDLTVDERQYFTAQRSRLMREIGDATGLVPEIRAEGVAMVDPEGSLTDCDMPEEGTDGHSALLVAQWLAEKARTNRKGSTPVGVSVAELIAHLKKLIQIHRTERKHWRKGVETPGYERVMAEQIVQRLSALRLIRCEGEMLFPRPAIARYIVDEPLIQQPAALLWADNP